MRSGLALHRLESRNFRSSPKTVSPKGMVEAMLADRLPAWRAPSQQFFVERDSLCLVVTNFVRIHRQVKNILRVKSEICFFRASQASEKKSGDNKECERAADLRDHEGHAQPLSSSGRAATRRMEYLSQVTARDA